MRLIINNLCIGEVTSFKFSDRPLVPAKSVYALETKPREPYVTGKSKTTWYAYRLQEK